VKKVYTYIQDEKHIIPFFLECVAIERVIVVECQAAI
jgi:hypothetical protein